MCSLSNKAFAFWRSIRANSPHLNPPQRNIVVVVWFPCATHHNCSRNDSINRVLQRSSLTFFFRFTKCDSVEAEPSHRGQRRETAVTLDAVQTKEMREDNESEGRKKSTKRYPTSHGLMETLGFCSVLEIHDGVRCT